MIDDVEGITMMVSDQQNAFDFYTTKLGFEKKVDSYVTEYGWITADPKNPNLVINLINPVLYVILFVKISL